MQSCRPTLFLFFVLFSKVIRLLTICAVLDAGGYIIEPWRLPEYILPDLSGFKVSKLLYLTKSLSSTCYWQEAKSFLNLYSPLDLQLKPYVAHSPYPKG